MKTIEKELIFEKIKNEKKVLIKVTPTYIKELMESKTEIKLDKKTRKRPYPYYRCIYYRLCKDFTKDSSLAEIGGSLNREKPFDHATVLHGLKRFEEWKEQNWFKDYFSFYQAISLIIHKEIANNPDHKKLLTVDDVKQHYKLIFIKLVEKYRGVINKQTKQIYNLKKDPIINEIANLDYETLEKLKPRLESFLLMNTRK